MYTFWLIFFIVSGSFLLALLVDDYLTLKDEQDNQEKEIT